MRIKPSPGYVLIEPINKETKTKGGIYVPSKGKSPRAKVIAIGKQTNKDGSPLEPEFGIGDTVVYRKWETVEAKIGDLDEPLIFVKYENILATEGGETNK